MPVYEALIMGWDRSLPHQVNEGDILAIRPYPWDWGKKEIEMGVVVLFEHDAKSHNELETALIDRIYEGGKTGREVDAEEQAAMNAKEVYTRPALLQKRTHKIKISELIKKMPAFDRAKAQAKDVAYQPFKKASKLVEKFDGKNGKHLITVDQVDAGDVPETEIILTQAEFEDALEQKTLQSVLDKIAEQEK